MLSQLLKGYSSSSSEDDNNDQNNSIQQSKVQQITQPRSIIPQPITSLKNNLTINKPSTNIPQISQQNKKSSFETIIYQKGNAVTNKGFGIKQQKMKMFSIKDTLNMITNQNDDLEDGEEDDINYLNDKQINDGQTQSNDKVADLPLNRREQKEKAKHQMMQKDIQLAMKYAGETYHRVAPPKIEINLLKSKRKQPEKLNEEEADFEDRYQVESNYYGNNKYMRLADDEIQQNQQKQQQHYQHYDQQQQQSSMTKDEDQMMSENNNQVNEVKQNKTESNSKISFKPASMRNKQRGIDNKSQITEDR